MEEILAKMRIAEAMLAHGKLDKDDDELVSEVWLEEHQKKDEDDPLLKFCLVERGGTNDRRDRGVAEPTAIWQTHVPRAGSRPGAQAEGGIVNEVPRDAVVRLCTQRWTLADGEIKELFGRLISAA
jgi:hypothetical protein